jgi:hypothetical protein
MTGWLLHIKRSDGSDRPTIPSRDLTSLFLNSLEIRLVQYKPRSHPSHPVRAESGVAMTDAAHAAKMWLEVLPTEGSEGDEYPLAARRW